MWLSFVQILYFYSKLRRANIIALRGKKRLFPASLAKESIRYMHGLKGPMDLCGCMPSGVAHSFFVSVYD